MAANEKFASDMRDALKAMMEADPYYSDIPIITERLQNIDAKVEGIVGKAGGICIVLVTPTFAATLPNLPGANFDAIAFLARVFENVKTNPTGKEAQHVAIYTAALWSQLKPDTFANPLKLDDPAIALGNDPRFLSYDVSALTNGGTAIDIPRLDAITIDSSNLAAVVLANSRPGASIFYTLDRSQPAPRNPAAAVYRGPFGGVSSFFDGTRLFTFDSGQGAFFTAPPSGSDYWQLNAFRPGEPDGTLDPANERAWVSSIVDGSGVGTWRYEKIAGVWQLNAQFSSDGDPGVVFPPDFSFFNSPGTTVRARAWLPGYIPSAELRQVL